MLQGRDFLFNYSKSKFIDMRLKGKQINDWIERAYKNAIKHGWHEENKSSEHWLMMICTEVSEAIQADRRDLYLDDLDKSGLECVLANDYGGGLVEDFYENNIEGKVESELADICIRLFDFMGVLGIKLLDEGEYDYIPYPHSINESSFVENAFYINCKICEIKEDLQVKRFVEALFAIFNWTEALDVDIILHINLKMRYNEKREYRHGNKKY